MQPGIYSVSQAGWHADHAHFEKCAFSTVKKKDIIPIFQLDCIALSISY